MAAAHHLAAHQGYGMVAEEFTLSWVRTRSYDLLCTICWMLDCIAPRSYNLHRTTRR